MMKIYRCSECGMQRDIMNIVEKKKCISCGCKTFDIYIKKERYEKRIENKQNKIEKLEHERDKYKNIIKKEERNKRR